MNESAYREAEAAFWATVDLTPKEHFVKLPTLGTTVRVQEVGEGEPVLFLHGGPNTGSTWVPIMPWLTGFRCLILDRPGTGLSEPHPIGVGTLDEFASTLATDVLDALEVESAHVVASSLGGYIAIHSVGRSPERYRRMVQMAAPAMLPGQTVPGFMQGLFRPGLRHLIAALPPSRSHQTKVLREIGHGVTADRDAFPDGMGEWYFQMIKHTDTQKHDFDLIHAARGKGGTFNPEVAVTDAELAAVTVPTHFIWGSDDAFDGDKAARRTVEAMPDATLEMLPDSGHLPWIDNPERVGRATAEFLSG